MSDSTLDMNSDYMVHSSGISLLMAKNREAILNRGCGYRSFLDYVNIKIPKSTLNDLKYAAIRRVAGALLKKGNEYRVFSADTDVNPITDHTIQVMMGDTIVAYIRVSIVDELNGFVICSKLAVSGEEPFALEFHKAFIDEAKLTQTENKGAMIKWIFQSGHGSSTTKFYLEKTRPVYDEFYPWIDEGLHAYYRKFMESEAQVLVLFGKPGTGKTSFIRDFVCEMGINALISYDMSILASDSAFVNYMTDDSTNAIVIEDADELLTAARGEYNKIVAKLLNVSDGLIKLPSKKLILTTNLNNTNDIDPAIIRRGRCYDVLEFRPLTRKEAQVVADRTGYVLPEGNAFSLAEIFNDGHEAHRTIKSKSMGFV